MTPEEAIEIINDKIHVLSLMLDPELITAILLGIEALKRLEDWRSGKVVNPDFMLPGETDG